MTSELSAVEISGDTESDQCSVEPIPSASNESRKDLYESKREAHRKRKKVQNKGAAARYRAEKKIQDRILSDEVQKLESEQKTLQAKYEELKNEISFLRSTGLYIVGAESDQSSVEPVFPSSSKIRKAVYEFKRQAGRAGGKIQNKEAAASEKGIEAKECSDGVQKLECEQEGLQTVPAHWKNKVSYFGSTGLNIVDAESDQIYVDQIFPSSSKFGKAFKRQAGRARGEIQNKEAAASGKGTEAEGWSDEVHKLQCEQQGLQTMPAHLKNEISYLRSTGLNVVDDESDHSSSSRPFFSSSSKFGEAIYEFKRQTGREGGEIQNKEAAASGKGIEAKECSDEVQKLECEQEGLQTVPAHWKSKVSYFGSTGLNIVDAESDQSYVEPIFPSSSKFGKALKRQGGRAGGKIQNKEAKSKKGIEAEKWSSEIQILGCEQEGLQTMPPHSENKISYMRSTGLNIVNDESDQSSVEPIFPSSSKFSGAVHEFKRQAGKTGGEIQNKGAAANEIGIEAEERSYEIQMLDCEQKGPQTNPAHLKNEVSHLQPLELNIVEISGDAESDQSSVGPVSLASNDLRKGPHEFKRVARRERKKVQNKGAAARYRAEKRIVAQELSNEVQKLVSEQKALQTKHDELKEEISYLKPLIKEILKKRGLLK